MSNLRETVATSESNEDLGIKIVNAWSCNETPTDKDTINFRKTGGDFEDVLQTHYFPKNSEILNDNDCVVICDDDDDEDPLAEDCLLVEEKDPLDTSDLTETVPGPSSTNDPLSAADSYEPAKKKPKVTEDPLKKKTEPKSNFEKTFLQFAQTTYKHSNLINEASYLSSRIGGTKGHSFVGHKKGPILEKYVQEKEDIHQNSNVNAPILNSEPLRNSNKSPVSQNSNLDTPGNPNLDPTISNSNFAGLQNPNLGPTVQNTNLGSLRNPNLGQTIPNSSFSGSLLRNPNNGPISHNTNSNRPTNPNLSSTIQNSTIDELRDQKWREMIQNFRSNFNQKPLGGETSQNITALKNLMSQFSNQNVGYNNLLSQNLLANRNNQFSSQKNQLLGPNNSLLGPKNSLSGPNNLHLGPNNSVLGPNNLYSSQNVAQISEQMKTVLQNSGTVPDLGNPFTENPILKQFLSQKEALQNPNLAVAAAQLTQSYLQNNGSSFGSSRSQNLNSGPQTSSFGSQNPNLGQNGPQNPNFGSNGPKNPNFGPNAPHNPNFGPNRPQNLNFGPNVAQNPNFGPIGLQNGASLPGNLNIGVQNFNMGDQELQNINLGPNSNSNPNSLLQNLRGSLNEKLGNLEPQNPGRLYYHFLNQLRNNPNQNLSENIQNIGANGPYDKNFLGQQQQQQQSSNLGRFSESSQGNPPNQKTNKKVIKRPRKSRLLLEGLEHIPKTNQNGPESQNQNTSIANLNVSNKQNRYRKENEPEIPIIANPPFESDPLSLDNNIKTENSDSKEAPIDFKAKNLGSETKLASYELGESPNLTTTNITIKTEPEISPNDDIAETGPSNDYKVENSGSKRTPRDFEAKNSVSEVKLAKVELGESPNWTTTNLRVKMEPEITTESVNLEPNPNFFDETDENFEEMSGEIKTEPLGEIVEATDQNFESNVGQSNVESDVSEWNGRENSQSGPNLAQIRVTKVVSEAPLGSTIAVTQKSLNLKDADSVNENYYWCLPCRKKFTNKNDLILHNMKHLALKKIKSTFCIICNVKFLDREIYKRHLISHKFGKTYFCRLCFVQFPKFSKMIFHKSRCKKKLLSTCQALYQPSNFIKTHLDSQHFPENNFNSQNFPENKLESLNLESQSRNLRPQESNEELILGFKNDSDSPNLALEGSGDPNLDSKGSHSSVLVPDGSGSPNLDPKGSNSPNLGSKETTSVNMASERSDVPNFNLKGSCSSNLSPEGSDNPNLGLKGSNSPNLSPKDSYSPNLAPEGSGSPNLASEGSASPNLNPKGSRSPNLTPKESGVPNLILNESQSPNLASKGSNNPILDLNPNSRSQNEQNTQNLKTDSNPSPKNNLDTKNLPQNELCSQNLVPNLGSRNLPGSQNEEPNLDMDCDDDPQSQNELCGHLNNSVSELPADKSDSDLNKVHSVAENVDFCVISNVFSCSEDLVNPVFEPQDRKLCYKCKGEHPIEMLVPKELLGKIFKCYECHEIFNDKVVLINHYVEKHWLRPKKVL